MTRPKGSKNKPKIQHLEFEGLPNLEQNEVNMKDVHHMVQRLSAENLEEADRRIREYLNNGYYIQNSFLVRYEDEFGSYVVLYILVKDE